MEENKVLTEVMVMLERVRQSNPWYFKALIDAAGIIPKRRANYSPNADPFENFKVAADIIKHYSKFVKAGITIDALDVIVFYQALKMARALTGGDSDYESVVDSDRDLANYSILYNALAKQMAEEREGYVDPPGGTIHVRYMGGK